MNDHIQRVSHFVTDAAREAAQSERSAHGDATFQRGFTSSAGIALRRIQVRVDEFRDRMKGPGLTKAEQVIYAQLDELKSEIEADCDQYWRGSGVDWRPLMPVVKGVIRRAGEADS